ncbi:MAG: hypothetical protein Q3M24_00135 [Candidatus Electrothrix aestuarii]|jgi:hypothetical protein|uniref:Uncharacterized protein n=1 Tax=Candidatus Electrothrix aestuarii TaxID=3062594 RepID=A0AAU8LVA3_9BACT|nr:hypothetical protein [Candidatus Electrothrix aestuarii]
MKVKEAVKLAKEHILDLFAEEDIRNLGLEEVEFDEEAKEWVVTLGFSRPWNELESLNNMTRGIAQFRTNQLFQRSYKVVRISDDSLHRIISVKNREVFS